jgi:hypothetical protein
VLRFARLLPMWMYEATRLTLPWPIFRAKMTLVRRSTRGITLRANVSYFGGLLSIIFNNKNNNNKSESRGTIELILSDPYGPLELEPPFGINREHSDADGHDVASSPEWWKRRKWGAPSSDDHRLHGTWEEEGPGLGEKPQRNPSGCNSVSAGEPDAAQRMLKDWVRLDLQSLVTNMMRQYGGTVLQEILFSPVAVARTMGELLEQEAKLEYWFSSFVEAHLIRDLLLDHRDSESWYSNAPFASPASRGTDRRTGGSNSRVITVKPLSESHVFWMQWRCFSSQVLDSLAKSRAITFSLFTILFSWINALLTFFLDQRQTHFLAGRSNFGGKK